MIVGKQELGISRGNRTKKEFIGAALLVSALAVGCAKQETVPTVSPAQAVQTPAPAAKQESLADSMRRIARECGGSYECITRKSSELSHSGRSSSGGDSFQEKFDKMDGPARQKVVASAIKPDFSATIPYRTDTFTVRPGDVVLLQTAFPSAFKVQKIDRDGVELDQFKLSFGQTTRIGEFVLFESFSAYEGVNGTAIIMVTYPELKNTAQAP